GAAVADECHHTGDGCLSGASTKEGCPSPVTKGLSADRAAIPHTLATMDTDGAFAELPPCRTVHVGAKYSLRIDDTPPSALKHRRVSPDPLSFSSPMARSPFSVHLPLYKNTHLVYYYL